MSPPRHPLAQELDLFTAHLEGLNDLTLQVLVEDAPELAVALVSLGGEVTWLTGLAEGPKHVVAVSKRDILRRLLSGAWEASWVSAGDITTDDPAVLLAVSQSLRVDDLKQARWLAGLE